MTAAKQGDEYVAKLEKLLKADPKNVPLRYALAGEYRDKKQYDKAKPLYDDLLRRAATLEAYERPARSEPEDEGLQTDRRSAGRSRRPRPATSTPWKSSSTS